MTWQRDAVHAAQACLDFASASHKMTRPDALRRNAEHAKAALETYLKADKAQGDRMTPRSRTPLLLCLLAALTFASCSQGCASAGGPRHVAAQGENVAHITLAALQDGEMELVCGRPTAPPAPACVPEELHKKTISPAFVEAFTYDKEVGEIILAMPEGALTPARALILFGKIGDLITHIIDSIPKSPQQAALAAKVGMSPPPAGGR